MSTSFTVYWWTSTNQKLTPDSCRSREHTLRSEDRCRPRVSPFGRTPAANGPWENNDGLSLRPAGYQTCLARGHRHPSNANPFPNPRPSPALARTLTLTLNLTRQPYRHPYRHPFRVGPGTHADTFRMLPVGAPGIGPTTTSRCERSVQM